MQVSSLRRLLPLLEASVNFGALTHTCRISAMTRKIPWLKDTSNKAPQSSSTPRTITRRPKRRRILGPNSDDDGSGSEIKIRTASKAHASPPPEYVLQSESMMEEGLDKDDRYRMVEDEFLDAAKQFTQHLHAAEYQRLKKAAKSQNAAIIHSISRPVITKIPDETRRKVESLAKARQQAICLQGLLSQHRRNSGSEEDEPGDAWVGTALHDLMDSPQKAATSLSRVTDMMITTRAAAGFNRTGLQKYKSHSSSPPAPRNRHGLSRGEIIDQIDAAHDLSEEDDDDLDAPVRPQEVLENSNVETFTTISTNSAFLQGLKTNQPTFIDNLKGVKESHVVDFSDEDMPSLVSRKSRQRIAKRSEQSKLREAKQQQEARKRLEIIPTFLS